MEINIGVLIVAIAVFIGSVWGSKMRKSKVPSADTTSLALKLVAIGSIIIIAGYLLYYFLS